MKNLLHCLILLLITASLICTDAVSGRYRKERERKKDKSKLQKDANLCTMQGNSAVLHCVCVGGSPPLNTTSAECWVFTGVTKDLSVWSLFATQPHITELKFLVRPQEQFTFVPTEGLRHLNYLRKLEITYANINEIQPYAFANSTTLYELTLPRNNIVQLDHHAFAHLTNLSELNLERNRIAEIRRHVFVDLLHLKRLLFSHNNLSVIQERSFRYLAHLLELDLQKNYISVLTRYTFSGLGELKRLDLSKNKISMLGDLTFSELWVLQELNLENNQIELISDRAFAGLNHLRILKLSHNRLAMLPAGLLGGVSTINDLDLHSNHLETLTFDSIQPIIHNLMNESGIFNIADNKFVCDCRLIWLHRLRNLTKSQSGNKLDEITCFDTSSLSNNNNNQITMPSVDKTIDNQFPVENLQQRDDNNDNDDDDIDKGNYDEDVDYDENYNDAMSVVAQQQDSSNNNKNYVTAILESDRHIINNNHPSQMKKHFFDIPVKELPCPQEEHPTEATRTYISPAPGWVGFNHNNNYNDANCSQQQFNVITSYCLNLIVITITFINVLT